MKNLLKKKVFIIPAAIILYIILFAVATKLIGAVTLVAGIGGSIYLYTKNDKFKSRHKAIKVLTGITIFFGLIVFGIGGLVYDPATAEQKKLAAEKVKVEQQAKEEQIKKEAEEKAKAEVDKKAVEEEAKQVEEKKANDDKAANLAKFNLKEAVVSRVVDGDTVELSDGSKVRFIGVNTPESTTKTEPYGKEASDYTKDQLTGKTVYLEKDVSETDKYGRLLRYIWLDIPSEINDSEIRAKMYNANLVVNGYAEVSTYPPDVKYQEYFTKYNAEARNSNKGLWAINSNGTTKGDSDNTSSSTSNSSSSNQNSGNTNSSNSSSSTKSTQNSSASSSNTSSTSSSEKSSTSSAVDNSANDNAIVYSTKTGDCYHAYGCASLKKSKIQTTVKNAKAAGLRPCSKCHPPQ